MISAVPLQREIHQFRNVFEEKGIELVIPAVQEHLEEAELIQIIVDIDGIICCDDHFTERVIQKATNLKVISKCGTGIDSIDQNACKKHGITVKNVPNAFTEPVADTVLGFIIEFTRRIEYISSLMHQGVWEKINCAALNECVLGVVGVGNIGKAIAKRARSFGMKLFGYDIIRIPDEFIKETSIRMVSLCKLLSVADFISINCDLNPTSFHLISKSEFSLMKKSSVIINTARGQIIDESCLVDALLKIEIKGAALDVYEDEPLKNDSPLLQMNNVLLSPHNSNQSNRAWQYVYKQAIKNLLDALF